MSRPLLEVRGLCMRFGGLLAVNGVNLSVREGQIVSMIGPNGAGKTTVFNCLNGFYRPTSGRSSSMASRSRACRGIASPARAWCAPSRTCACSRR